MVEDVAPQKVWEELHDNPQAELCDVRTEAEWNFVGLPDLSGFELCARIRAHARLAGVPIFMSTGRGDVEDKAEASGEW